MDAEEAIVSRRSVRGFRPDPVPRATIEHILQIAATAPSGTNMQPWQVYVVGGDSKRRLSEAVLAERRQPTMAHEPEYRYYPAEWREPYIGRRRKVGIDMYTLIGIPRGDKEAMFRQHGRNFEFFGAPVGLFFAIDKDLEIGSWLDYGMFIGAVMTAARAQGLHSCPQAAWPPYHRIIRQQLGMPEGQTVVCGMALGYEDEADPANRLRTEREPVNNFAKFIDL